MEYSLWPIPATVSGVPFSKSSTKAVWVYGTQLPDGKWVIEGDQPETIYESTEEAARVLIVRDLARG